jgi:hypothetical protein
LLQPGCAYNYYGMFLESITCGIPVGDISPGEYRGEFCRTVYPSSTCVETLLNVYFNAVP